ncbi:unnamed protein product, partial [marine sediment metagenome]
MAKVKAKYEAKGKPLTEAGLMRVASYELTDYWHIIMRHRPTMLSLNNKADGNGDGEPSEIIDFLADDTIDIVARLDARRCLQGMPRRLVQIAYKRYAGYKLTAQEQHYLGHYRASLKRGLFLEQLNIEGKRSGNGFVAHRAMLVNALSRALADRVMLMDLTIGRKGFVGYLKALGG